MKVNRNQIVAGIEQFVRNDVMSKITDRALNIVIETALVLLKRRPEKLDPFLHNDFFHEDRGQYDLDEISEVLQDVLSRQGAFPVVIPAVPFISPTEKVLSFSADDVATLKRYIEGGNANDRKA